MKLGDTVFFYINKALKEPLYNRKLGSIAYHRVSGKIIKIYEKGKRLTGLEIEELFNIKPGDQEFGKFYSSNVKMERIVMRTSGGVCYLFTEDMWKHKTFGSDRYVEIASNSLDFILGD